MDSRVYVLGVLSSEHNRWVEVALSADYAKVEAVAARLELIGGLTIAVVMAISDRDDDVASAFNQWMMSDGWSPHDPGSPEAD